MHKAEAIREFAASEEFPIQAGDEGAYRTETYNQWVYDPIADVGLNIWFASSERSFPNFLSTIIIYEGGRTWTAKSDGQGNPPAGVGGGSAFLKIVEPYKRLHIEQLGLLSPFDAIGGGTPAQNEGVELGRMDLAVDIASPPVEQGSQGDRGEAPSSGTVPRTAIRYEQLCRITGPIRIGERTIQLKAYGMRSHRRNSASIYDSGAVGHTWATAFFPSGRGFHLLSYQVEPSAKVGFLYGHYFDGERYHDAEVTRFPYYSGGSEPESYELEFKVQGRTIQVVVETLPPLHGTIPPHGIGLTRSPGRFRMDGEVGGGVLERSLAPRFQAGGFYPA